MTTRRDICRWGLGRYRLVCDTDALGEHCFVERHEDGARATYTAVSKDDAAAIILDKKGARARVEEYLQ